MKITVVLAVLLVADVAASRTLHGQSDSAAPNAAPAAFWPAHGVFPVPGRTSSWPGFRERNIERRTLFARNREQERERIVFVGDSITEGWETLAEDFADTGARIANRGIAGDTTPNLVYRFDEDVLALRPRALVLLIGTNDLAEGTPPAQIASNLRELHRRIRAAVLRLPIAWCLVMPRGDDEKYLELVRELNARLQALLASDSHTVICDTFTPMLTAGGDVDPKAFLPDRLHLSREGYARWGRALRSTIAAWTRHPE